MTHEQALKDYKKLTEIACGGPNDVSIFFETIAEDLLASPCKKTAKRILSELIERYFDSGDAAGGQIDDIEAIEIFERHGFFRPDEGSRQTMPK